MFLFYLDFLLVCRFYALSYSSVFFVVLTWASPEVHIGVSVLRV